MMLGENGGWHQGSLFILDISDMHLMVLLVSFFI